MTRTKICIIHRNSFFAAHTRIHTDFQNDNMAGKRTGTQIQPRITYQCSKGPRSLIIQGHRHLQISKTACDFIILYLCHILGDEQEAELTIWFMSPLIALPAGAVAKSKKEWGLKGHIYNICVKQKAKAQASGHPKTEKPFSQTGRQATRASEF